MVKIIRTAAILFILSTGSSFAQNADKQYTVVLTWSQWLKIGALLDNAPIGQYSPIYNEIQKQFYEQNARETSANEKAAEDRLRKKVTEETEKSTRKSLMQNNPMTGLPEGN